MMSYIIVREERRKPAATLDVLISQNAFAQDWLMNNMVTHDYAFGIGTKEASPSTVVFQVPSKPARHRRLTRVKTHHHTGAYIIEKITQMHADQHIHKHMHTHNGQSTNISSSRHTELPLSFP
jgi:hypothetical protein